MQAKKEYLILIIIIIMAGLYLVFHKKDQTQYTLPEITKCGSLKNSSSADL